MSAFVDSQETERATLLDLAVNNAIRRCDIGVATAVETWLSHFITDHFTTQPIAYSLIALLTLRSDTEANSWADHTIIVCIPRIHHDLLRVRLG